LERGLGFSTLKGVSTPSKLANQRFANKGKVDIPIRRETLVSLRRVLNPGLPLCRRMHEPFQLQSLCQPRIFNKLLYEHLNIFLFIILNDTMEAKPLLFWILGTVFILFGAMIAGQARPDVLGATAESFAISIILAFILILFGGLLWISVAGVIHK